MRPWRTAAEAIARRAPASPCSDGASDPRSALVRVQPRTGRRHQVRRHLRDVDHPILGDTSHGDSRENVRWRAEHGLQRLALHCLHLAFPWDGVRHEVFCPPAADLVTVWRQQPWWLDAVASEPRLQAQPLPLLAPEVTPAASDRAAR